MENNYKITIKIQKKISKEFWKKFFGFFGDWTGDWEEVEQVSYPLDQVDLLNKLWKFKNMNFEKRDLENFEISK